MNPAKYETTFIKKLQRTSDVYSFYFQRPAGFTYIAGQYNRWVIPITNPDERGNNRYFTICSAPSEKDHLMLTTKISRSSFKQTLLTFSPGQEIEIFGPLGKFVLDDPAYHHVFIAGGIGITPYRSMVVAASITGWKSPITLFSSFSKPEDVIFHDEFETIQKNHSWFTLYETVTHPEESQTPWTGLTGRIDKATIMSKIPDISNCMFYLCGPPAMVEAMEPIIKEFVHPTRVKVEKFTGY